MGQNCFDPAYAHTAGERWTDRGSRRDGCSQEGWANRVEAGACGLAFDESLQPAAQRAPFCAPALHSLRLSDDAAS